MPDINLLPEDLRKKDEAAHKQAASEIDGLDFSEPQDKAKLPQEGAAPGRWQQLMSAIAKNMNTPSQENTYKLQPSSPAQVKKPSATTNEANITTAPLIKAAQPAPTPPTPKPLIPKAKPEIISRKGSVPPPSILDVNLIPSQEGKQLTGRTLTAVISLVIASIVITGLGYFSLKTYVDKKVEENDKVQQEVIELQQKLEQSRQQTENAITTRRRVQILAQLLTQRSQWKNFFSWLEKNTIPLVQLGSLAADANGRVVIIGQAPNFTEVGRQMLAFKQSQEVLDVSLGGVTVDVSNTSEGPVSVVNFTFTVKLPTSLFSRAY